MADPTPIPILQLPQASALTGAEVYPCVQGGVTKKTTITSGSGGTLQSAVFTASGTWNVPAAVSGAWATGVGGGGGGRGTAAAAAASGGGGGAGEEGTQIPLPVTPGGTVSVTIGAAGPGGVGGVNGTDGGTTIVGPYQFIGGKGSVGVTAGGSGGGAGGAVTVSGVGVLGTAEHTSYFGGSSGGATSVGASAGQNGGGSGGHLIGGVGGVGNTKAGGGGGAATVYGVGGAGGAGEANGINASATSYGAGGGGAGSNAATPRDGGNGAPGYAVIFFIA